MAPLKILVLCLATMLLVCVSSVAFAQAAPAAGTSGVLAILASWPQWVQLAVGLLGAVVALATALSAILGFASGFWPSLGPAAAWCSNFGMSVHNLAAKLAGLVPGSVAHAAKMAAKRAAPPLLILLAGGLALGHTACTAAEVTSGGQTALTYVSDMNQACIDAQELAAIVDPSLPAPTIASLRTDCAIGDSVADALIQDAMNLFGTQPATQAAKKKVGAKLAH